MTEKDKVNLVKELRMVERFLSTRPEGEVERALGASRSVRRIFAADSR
jgi:hypothetical protein